MFLPNQVKPINTYRIGFMEALLEVSKLITFTFPSGSAVFFVCKQATLFNESQMRLPFMSSVGLNVIFTSTELVPNESSPRTLLGAFLQPLSVKGILIGI